MEDVGLALSVGENEDEANLRVLVRQILVKTIGEGADVDLVKVELDVPKRRELVIMDLRICFTETVKECNSLHLALKGHAGEEGRRR